MDKKCKCFEPNPDRGSTQDGYKFMLNNWDRIDTIDEIICPYCFDENENNAIYERKSYGPHIVRCTLCKKRFKASRDDRVRYTSEALPKGEML